ncbi:MAG: NADH-quinone oxidoreductase subunit L [Planctomycetes bacterium]|nr:NADH-quinone oxidoreductase subunit L [Planctomycetota bacterium]
MVTANQAYLIPLFPLLAFVINILFGRYVKDKACWISVGASALSCIIAWPLIVGVIRGTTYHHDFAWLALGGIDLRFGYLLDPLAATLLFVVTLVGTLIQIYAIGYMKGEARFSRFFAYLSLFMFGMLGVVISDNFLLFFMCWEIMGLCSYLLIGFYSEKDSAANACKKAFLTTRVGDVGFLLGILALFTLAGTLSFAELHDAVELHRDSQLMITVTALLLFCGTIGKSAQVPLHVWLPDAMEGPTPVSALIHAATMVAAGVFLVARAYPLIEASELALRVIAIVGTVTALMAACVALTATDIKKVLAYSTISQLGYMVAAMGCGAMVAGIFHLMTHAFFKALLFLGAGSVIHGTGTQDLREMGGLFPKMKHTAWTFLIASLAIAGVPPLAGFWSKDEILLAAHQHGNLYYVALSLTAFLTAFYMFRLFVLTFLGKPRNPDIHAHESPKSMIVPLWVLAVGSILVGLPGSFLARNWFQDFLHGGHGDVEHHVNVTVMITSIALGLVGIALAFLLYRGGLGLGEKLAKVFALPHRVSLNKFWIDEVYDACLVRPWHALGQLLIGFEAKVVDGTVNGTGAGTLRSSRVSDWIDKYIVDGTVNFIAAFTQFFSDIIRLFQTGFIQNYLLILFAAVVFILYFGIR